MDNSTVNRGLFVDLVRQEGHVAALAVFEQLRSERVDDELEDAHLRSALAGAARLLSEEHPRAADDFRAALREIGLAEAAERVRQRRDDYRRQRSGRAAPSGPSQQAPSW